MKRLLIVVLSLLLATPVSALDMVITAGGASTMTIAHSLNANTISLIMGGGALSPSVSVANYGFLQDQMQTFQTVTTKAAGAASTPGTFRNLRVQVQTAPENGAGTQSYAYTVYKNGSATALTCTISESSTTCTDTVNSFTVIASDLLTLEYLPSGTPVSNTFPIHSVQFDANNAGESLFLGGSRFAVAADGGLPYLPLGGDGKNGIGTAYNALTLIPTSGYIQNLTVSGVTDPGVGNSYIWTLQTATNGSSVLADTALTCTITSGQTSCTGTTPVYVTADDVAILTLTYGGAPANSFANWGVTFLADTLGEFILAATGKDPSQTVTQYGFVSSLAQLAWNNGETNADQIGTIMSINALYADLGGALGVGNSYTLTLRKNAASTALTCVVTSNQRRCNLTGTPVAVVDNDLLSSESIPFSIPTQQNALLSYLVTMAPINRLTILY